jgi:hypothetical protein
MLFSAVKRILLRNIVAIARSRRLNADQVVQKVATHLESMTDEWYAGEAPSIAYDDPLCRWAYMYAHAPVQANLFHNVLVEAGRRSTPFGRKLIQEEVSMVVFGGGPGTELLGLAKYYLDLEGHGTREQIEVRLDVIDRVPE